MNYVILNGAKSTDVKGLLIQSLPPISKPLMRTSIEEIDGRDGDIVTKLGYAAYDKAMSIGLFGDYDVDDVIRFFDSEGTVIFSNEPDKFYKYQIIEQIDFERLIRFKTATVTFHVQPFKYSAVDDVFKFSKSRMSLKKYTATKNDVTVNAENGVISIQGRASEATEFYVPIDAMTLNKGNYTLQGLTDGSGESACAIRVIGDNPSDADSFGETYLSLQNDGVVSMRASLAVQKTFNYVWIYITSGTTMSFTLNVNIYDDIDSFSIVNRGNAVSRPKLTILGAGAINLSINGVELFRLNLGDSEYITLDGIQMNAYQGNVLKNRSVAGNYDNLRLKVGKNTISWTGHVAQIEVEQFSRWI